MTLEHQVEEGFWKYFAGWRKLDKLREEALQDAFAGRETHDLPEEVASSIAKTANSEYVNTDMSGNNGTAPKPIPTDLTPEVRNRLVTKADSAEEEYILKENGKEYFLARFETETREGKRHNGHLVVRLSERPEGLLDYLWLATKTMDDAGELIQKVKTLNIDTAMRKVENLFETYGEKFKDSFRAFLEKDAPHLLKVLQQPATIEEPIPIYKNGYKCSILEESARKPYLLSWKWIDSVREQTLDGLFERIERGRSGKQEGFFEEATTKELRRMLMSEYIALNLGKKEYVDGIGYGLDNSSYSPSDEGKEKLVAVAKESATGRFVTQDGKRFFVKSLKTRGEGQDGYLIVDAPETANEDEEDAQKLYLSLIGETLDDAGYAINELQKKTDGHLVAARMLLRSDQQRQDITDFLNSFEETLGVITKEPKLGLNGEDIKEILKDEGREERNDLETKRLIKQYIGSVKKKHPDWENANQKRYFASIAGIDFSLEPDLFFERYKENLNRVIKKRESFDLPNEKVHENSYTSIADILKTDAYKERKSGHFPTVTEITDIISTRMLKQLPINEQLKTKERERNDKLSEYELIQRIILDMNDTPGEGEMPEADRGGKYSIIRNFADLSEACMLEAALYAKKEAKSNGMKILVGNPNVKSALEGYGSRIDKIFGEGHTKTLLEAYGFNK